MNIYELEKLTSNMIKNGGTEEIKDFAIHALDFINEFNRVADHLAADPFEYSMISPINELRREVNTQRRTIAELRKRPARDNETPPPPSPSKGWSI